MESPDSQFGSAQLAANALSFSAPGTAAAASAESVLPAGPRVRQALAGRGVKTSLPAVALYVLAIAALLFATNAFHSEFSGYPDEPAHYINGLLIRDYALHGIPQSPLKFAIEYYLHYPKVTLGHWPPLFHIFEGLWMILFTGSRASVLIMMGVWTLLTALALRRAAESFGPVIALLLGLLFLLLPMTQDQLTMTMTEMPLALFCLLSMTAWARYLADGARNDAIWFGVWAACAILVKGDAWALAPAAALTIVFTGRWDRVREPRFWIPAAIVGAFCVPYYWRTRAWAALGWEGGTEVSWKFTRDAFAKFLPYFRDTLGWPILLFLIGGVAAYALVRKYRAQARYSAMLAFAMCAVVLEVIVPAGMEERKIFFLLPECFILVGVGIEMAGSLLPGARRYGGVMVMGAILAAFLIFNFKVVKRFDRGFRDLARIMHQRLGNQTTGLMVHSSGPFEGAMICEFAQVFPYPSVYLLRATQVLEEQEWIGPVHLLYNSPDELDAALRRSHIRVLVIHNVSTQSWKLSDQIEPFVASKAGTWPLLYDYTTRTERGIERVQAWELEPVSEPPDLSPVMKRLHDRRLAPAHVNEDAR
jgi:hypothetical protein